jgi:hypothetical protein
MKLKRTPNKKIKNITLHARMVDPKAEPVGVAIHRREIVHIEINRHCSFLLLLRQQHHSAQHYSHPNQPLSLPKISKKNRGTTKERVQIGEREFKRVVGIFLLLFSREKHLLS